jgi:hypothetical protein
MEGGHGRKTGFQIILQVDPILTHRQLTLNSQQAGGQIRLRAKE